MAKSVVVERLVVAVSMVWALVVAIWGQGYVHPDEFFQSVEIGARDVLGRHVQVAWEWGGAVMDDSWRQFVPCRSISFAAFAAHMPLWIGGRVLRIQSRRLLLIAPRVWAWAWSILNDILVRRVWHRCGVDVDAAHLAYRTSWTTWVLQTRPLSNAYECFMLSVALMLCYCRRPFTLGAAVAVGCFWRFSFVAYAFPLGVSFASDPRSIASGICGFALIAACLVAADSWYFGRLVATPYANFRFNANSDRLAAFGLHPWWTHMFLNMPLLFGHFPFFFFSRANGRLLILRASAAFAVLALSTSRHQEARFLLPAAAAVFATGIRRSALALWVVTNLCIGSFFAFVHQAGLVKLLLADHGKSATCLILVGTYVAPRSLLPPTVSAADFLQEDLDEFGQFLDADCCFQSKTLVRRLAVAASVPFRQLECALIARGFVARHRDSFWPHFSGEYLPSTFAQLQLHLYDIGLAPNHTVAQCNV